MNRTVLLAVAGAVVVGYVIYSANQDAAPVVAKLQSEDVSNSNMLAHCATVIGTAKDQGYLPTGASMASADITNLDLRKKRDQCAASDGPTYFQVTYDRTCDQGFEPRCSTLVSIVRASDGKILFVAKQ